MSTQANKTLHKNRRPALAFGLSVCLFQAGRPITTWSVQRSLGFDRSTQRMKSNVVIAIFVGLFLIAVGVAATFSEGREHDPKDLSYWVRAGAGKDWSAEAAQGEPQAQFHFGRTLIRTNLMP